MWLCFAPAFSSTGSVLLDMLEYDDGIWYEHVRAKSLRLVCGPICIIVYHCLSMFYARRDLNILDLSLAHHMLPLGETCVAGALLTLYIAPSSWPTLPPPGFDAVLGP